MFEDKEIKITISNRFLNNEVINKFLSREIKEIRIYSKND